MFCNLQAKASASTLRPQRESSKATHDEEEGGAADAFYVDNECRWLVFVRKDVKKRLFKQSIFGVAQSLSLDAVESDGSLFTITSKTSAAIGIDLQVGMNERGERMLVADYSKSGR